MTSDRWDRPLERSVEAVGTPSSVDRSHERTYVRTNEETPTVDQSSADPSAHELDGWREPEPYAEELDSWPPGQPECPPCAHGACEHCWDDGRYNSPNACECARSTHGPNGIGVWGVP